MANKIITEDDGSGDPLLNDYKSPDGSVEKIMRNALRPFAALLDTRSNGYEISRDEEIVRSVGTYGRDYAFITVGDLRRAKAAISALMPLPDGTAEQLRAAQHCIARETTRTIHLEQTIRDSIEIWRNRIKFLKVDGTWRNDDGIDAVLGEFLAAIEALYTTALIREDEKP